MASIKYSENIKLIKSIVDELRLATREYRKSDPKLGKIKNSVTHMLNLMKENQITERRFCRPKDHYKYFAQTYLTYLKSTRLNDNLTQKYYNKGDRSVKESARLVGLEVPERKNF